MSAEEAGLREGDMACVLWGEGKGVKMEAVIGEREDGGYRVTFDGPTETHPLLGCSAWLAQDAVRALPAPGPSVVPQWLCEGHEVRVLREASLHLWENGHVPAARLQLNPGLLPPPRQEPARRCARPGIEG